MRVISVIRLDSYMYMYVAYEWLKEREAICEFYL